MTPETIGVTVTFKEPVTFHLRMIGIQEENALRQKMFGLTEAEKAEKAYQNNVDMLADLSVKHADGLFKIKESSETENVLIQRNSPQEAIREYFKERTVIKERLAEYAVRGYFIKLQPEVFFF
jgi:hypothetical protein